MFGALGSLFSNAGGSIVETVGGLVGTAMTNASNRSENKKAYERNLHMWNLENEYNHPVQQMARLKEANLNPNMVYNNGATTLSASTKSSSAPTIHPYQFNILDALNSYQDIKQKDATINNIEAQTQNTRLQGDLFRLELERLRGGLPTSKDPYVYRLTDKVVRKSLETGQNVGDRFSKNFLDIDPYNRYNYYKATLGGKK